MKKKYLSLLLLSAFLSSCTGKIYLEYIPFVANDEIINTHFNIVEENYYQVSEQGEITFPEGLSVNGINSIDSIYDLKRAGEKKMVYAPLKKSEEGYLRQDLKLLVVPVSFIDSPTYNNIDKQNEMIIKLQNAFFGHKKMNQYYSVSEYYYLSSYGHVSLSGEVTPFYQLNMTASELENKISSAQNIASDISGWLRSDDFPIKDKDFSIYDGNNDNYIDGLYIIYDHPSQHDNEEDEVLFWQLTDQISDNSKGFNYSNNHNPKVRDYSWSSFDCLGPSNKVSSNYYIHETGHLFGLEDYYNTGQGYYQPTGFMDMMDYNLGDHTAFSKYLLNWTTPYVVTGEGEITISSFHKTGQFILVPANLDRYRSHNTPYDEYLLLEFFTPNGLNDNKNFASYLYVDKDGEQSIFNYPSTYGLKVYHVDARLAAYSNASLYFDAHCLGLLDNLNVNDISKTKAIYYRYDNETSTNANNNTPVLYHLLEKEGENTFINGQAASDYILFKYGDTFGVDTFTDFKFHGGELLPYSFEITGFTTKNMTIKFIEK